MRVRIVDETMQMVRVEVLGRDPGRAPILVALSSPVVEVRLGIEDSASTKQIEHQEKA